MMVLPERRDAPRPCHTIGEGCKESRMARVASLVPLRCGFAQTRRVARAEQVTDRVMCCSRQAEHGYPVFAQPAVHSTARRSRGACFLPPRCLCARAPTTRNDPLAVGPSHRAARRTREFTARTCPSRLPARIRAPAGLRASGIRATGAAIQRRPIKSWAQPTKQRGAGHTPTTPSSRPQFLAAPGATGSRHAFKEPKS